ncbi:MAG: adenylate/guanylate cyclase domain-containing protein [Myxococcota bacterium]|nr:adenylate/guanylate cyclase domain-containing protein [Myxococcota bacterium]
MASKTRTVVFTDLAGYTDTVSRSDRESLRELLSEHERVVMGLIESHGGRVVKNLGDSYMALFDCATDALRMSLEAVEGGLRGGGMKIRVSCATGDIEEIEGDAFGDMVNLSARINSKTPAGQVWFSESTRLCMNSSEIPWEQVGSFTLKGIPGDVPLYRAVPLSHCWLPSPVARAVKKGTLSIVKAGETAPTLPPDPYILFEGFEPGSAELNRAVDALPVLDPGKLWLAVYALPPSDRHSWQGDGRGLVIGTPDALATAIAATKEEVKKPVGTHTIILDTSEPAELELVMAGLALPSVPMANVVGGYTYDLLPDGRWVNRSPQAVMRIDIAPSGVQCQALAAGIEVNGKMLPSGTTIPLNDHADIRTPSGPIQFKSITEMSYAGVLLSDTPLRLGVKSGEKTELGREPNHPGIALPDRRGQENIRWCTGGRAARARESGFTLDRALAGRRQASIEVESEGNCTVNSLHDRCPTWLLGDSGQFQRIDGSLKANVGDLIVTGTSVIALRQPDLLD